ncbi:MAG TPA: DUF3006 domain-containing protein [Clostridia bacterium]|nr:DUF3006 domain-containing protein [Clostridia bacterium]
MLIADRFEGDFIICTDDEGTPVSLEKASVLAPVKEGDILIETQSGCYRVDKALSKARRRSMRKRLDSIFGE